ncbi:hypothetical protein [Pseudobacillus wudalianchiensis]
MALSVHIHGLVANSRMVGAVSVSLLDSYRVGIGFGRCIRKKEAVLLFTM